MQRGRVGGFGRTGGAPRGLGNCRRRWRMWFERAPLAGRRGTTVNPDAGLDDAGADATEAGLIPVRSVNPTETQFLSGHGSDDPVPWDFYCASALANNRNCTGTNTSGT